MREEQMIDRSWTEQKTETITNYMLLKLCSFSGMAEGIKDKCIT
jgi:hypothetical protein